MTQAPAKTLVVDGDGHVMEPGDTLWVDRMDHDKWGDWIPRRVVEDEIYEIIYTGGEVRGGGRELQDQMAAAVGMTAAEVATMLDQPAACRAATNPTPGSPRSTPTASTSPCCTPRRRCSSGRSTRSPRCTNVEFVADCQRCVQRLDRRVLRGVPEAALRRRRRCRCRIRSSR